MQVSKTKEQCFYMSLMGHSCRAWRMSMGYTQKQVADETGYTENTISLFEHGETNNAIVLLWYLTHGFNVDEDLKVYEFSKGRYIAAKIDVLTLFGGGADGKS